MSSSEKDPQVLTTPPALVMADSEPPARSNVYWFRGTIFQILVVGGVFFCVRPETSSMILLALIIATRLIYIGSGTHFRYPLFSSTPMLIFDLSLGHVQCLKFIGCRWSRDTMVC